VRPCSTGGGRAYSFAVIRDTAQAGLDPLRWIMPLLADGRATLLATAPVVWLGVSLLPDVHASLRIPAWLGLATLVGLGAELATRVVAPESAWRRGWGTFWFVPAGTVFLAVAWFSVLADRSRTFVPLAVAAVVAAMVMQRLEVAGPSTIRAGAHAISIGLAFAIAFVAYATATQLRSGWALAMVGAATLLAALIVLRDARASRRSIVGLAVATSVVVTELALILGGGPAVAWIAAAMLVLALYATSGVGHAVLEKAPRNVYVELGLVSSGGLITVLIGATRIW
jgi:hypothetical protein